jgi:putative addiction module CopG family antidote
MTIQLPPDVESIVLRAISSSSFTDEADVVRSALRLYEQFVNRRESLKEEIEKGIQSGPPIPGEVVFRELEEIAQCIDLNT